MPEDPAQEDARAIYSAANAAEEAWQRELDKAFGHRACNRRYDRNTSDHPPAANAAKAVRDAAVSRWLATLRQGARETA